MSEVYLGLGTNLGNKADNIAGAIRNIEELIGDVVRQTALYGTKPWGFESDNDFVNAVVCVETRLSPHEVLAMTQQIERSMGRTEKSENGIYHDRIIDIDILLYDEQHINEPTLMVPHPLMMERDFVVEPLSEIADMEKIRKIIG